MIANRKLGLLAEDHIEILEGRQVFRQPSATDRRTRLAALTATFGIRQIDHAVLLEVGRQHHIEQPALPVGPDLRHTAERTRKFAIDTDHPQVARPFGHQHPLATGEERQRPGMLQTFNDRRDLKGALLTFQFLGRRCKHGRTDDQYAGK